MNQEEWLDIPKWEGYYEVSNLGRVRSLERYIEQKGSKRIYKRKIKPRFLKPHKCGSGYLTVTLSKGEKQSQLMIHRIVAEVFIPCDTANYEVCHNDGNKCNNVVSNLRWDSRSGNFADKIKHGTDANGTKNPMAKLNSQQIKEIRNMEGTLTEIADKFSVSISHVSNIRNRKSRALR
jgi:hypothetical protein